MSKIRPEVVKRESETIILSVGGQICDWLPVLDYTNKLRSIESVSRRALVLCAMLQIYFGAPIERINYWLEQNSLSDELADSEREILALDDSDISEQQRINLYWSIEALWALVWVGSLIDALPFDLPVQNSLASLCPNFQQYEDGAKFAQSMQLRSYDDLFQMCDLYYRVHWWTRNAQLQGTNTGDVSIDIIMERRKALEWVMSPDCEWDSVELNT